jgi:alpha-beta hydrolase superfamily lysophospholipase
MIQRLEGYFDGYDESELFYQSWQIQNPHATLVVTHGIGEHSESYNRFAQGMSGLGFQTYAWDLRGHGRSSGNRGTVARFQDYSKDLDRFLKHLTKEGKLTKPYFLLGHSMGGLVTTLKVVDTGDSGANGIILSSPLFGIGVPVPQLKEQAARWVSQFVPKLTLHNEIDYRDLTHDRTVTEEYERDVLRHDQISVGLFVEMAATIEYVKNNIDRFKSPVFVQQAGDERIVSRKATEWVFEKIGASDKTLKIYEDMLHEIYNEIGRATVFSDLATWLEAHL